MIPLGHNKLLEALVGHKVPFVIVGGHAVTGVERLVPVSPPYVASTHLMMLVTDYGFLDLFDFVPGFPDADAREAFDESVPLNELRYVSLPWLKRMKAAANRPRDVDDLEQLG